MTSGVAWLAAALLLGVAELLVPGVFLVFLAAAAAITGAIALAVPGLPLAAEIAAFGLWSVVAVLIGRRWYLDYPQGTDDALLNDRAGRMAGQVVTVDTAIANGTGRVRIGDGSWPALGADAPAGARVRIASVDGGVVHVEPVEAGGVSA